MSFNFHEQKQNIDWSKISDEDLNSMYRQSMRGMRTNDTEDREGRKIKRVDSMQFNGSEWDQLGMTNIDHLHYGHDGSRTGYDDQRYYVNQAFDSVQSEYQKRLDERLNKLENPEEKEEKEEVVEKPDAVKGPVESSQQIQKAKDKVKAWEQSNQAQEGLFFTDPTVGSGANIDYTFRAKNKGAGTSNPPQSGNPDGMFF